MCACQPHVGTGLIQPTRPARFSLGPFRRGNTQGAPAQFCARPRRLPGPRRVHTARQSDVICPRLASRRQPAAHWCAHGLNEPPAGVARAARVTGRGTSGGSPATMRDCPFDHDGDTMWPRLTVVASIATCGRLPSGRHLRRRTRGVGRWAGRVSMYLTPAGYDDQNRVSGGTYASPSTQPPLESDPPTGG